MKARRTFFSSTFATCLLFSCFPLPVAAAPVEEALNLAEKLRSPYAAVYLGADPKLSGTLEIRDINNLGTIVGYTDASTIGYTEQVRATGFVLTADGTTTYTASLMGRNLIPSAINDRGQIAGVFLQLESPTQRLLPAVYTPGTGAQVISGLPPEFDQAWLHDINQNGDVLLSVSTLIESRPEDVNNPNIPLGPRYIRRTFVATRNSAGAYQAAERALSKDFGYTSYYTLRGADRPNDSQASITGLIPTHLSEAGIVFGRSAFSEFGFSHVPGLGSVHLFVPSLGPIDGEQFLNASANFGIYQPGSVPVDLGGSDFLLTRSTVLDVKTGMLAPGFVNRLNKIYEESAIAVDGAILGYSEKNTHPSIVRSDGSVVDLECALPQPMKLETYVADTMNDVGWVLVKGIHLSASPTFSSILLIPTRHMKPKVQNYCPTVSAKLLDRCGRKMNSDGEYIIAPNTACRASFEVRDVTGRPVARANAMLVNGEGKAVAFGRTDSRGRGTFLHRFNPDKAVYSVVAPIGHPTLRSGEASIKLQPVVNNDSGA